MLSQAETEASAFINQAANAAASTYTSTEASTMTTIVANPPPDLLLFSTQDAIPPPANLEQTLGQQLGRTIRTLRKSQGLNLERLATLSGISLGFLSGVELGKNGASLDTLHRIATGLGTTMATLLEGIGPGTKSNHRGAVPRP